MLLVISYFLGPRLFSGVRIDDLLLLLYLLPFLLKINLFKFNNPLGAYLIFLLMSLLLLVYGLLNGVESEIGIIFFVKYLTYSLAGFASYHYARLYPCDNDVLVKLILLMIGLNTVWLIVAEGDTTFWKVGGDVNSYGVKLIGEAAALQVGMMLVFSSIFILLVSKNKNFLKKSLYLLWFFILSYFTYESQSRVSLLGLLLSSLMIIIYFFRSYYYLNVSILLGALIVGGVYIEELQELLEFSSNRFTLSGLQSGFWVRIDYIWGDVLNSIEQHTLLGTGVGSLELINSDTVEVHNYYLKLLLEGGVVYLLLFVFFIISSILFFCVSSKGSVKPELRVASLCILLCLITSSFVQDSFASTKVILPFFMVLGFALGTRDNLKNENINTG